MKNREDLHLLIGTMSKSEKRYFTLDAQRSGRQGSRYLELFQAINAQKSYDEQPLKEAFGPSLPHDKRYLYEAILRSMRDYRSARSHAARIREMVLDAKYLYERGLYDQSEARLEEARAMAIELDDHLVLLEINKELRFLTVIARKNYDEKINSLLHEKDGHIEAVTEEFKYLDIGYELLMELRKNLSSRDAAQRQHFLDTHTLRHSLSAATPPSSRHALRLYHQCMALWAQLEGEQDRMMRHYLKVVDWWEEHPKFKEEEVHRYLRDISNLLHAYATKGRYDELPALVAKLEHIQASNVYDKSLIFQRAAIYKLMYYINTGRSEGVGGFVAELEKGLDQYQVGVSSSIALMFNVAVLLFINEDFRQCQHWCRRITKGQKTGLRLDIQKGAQVLNLFAAFEVQDAEDFDKTLRSTLRYYAKAMVAPGSFEHRVYDLLRKIAHAPINEQRATYRELAAYLTLLREDPTASVALGLDELLGHYTESRITKRPMLGMVQEMHRKRQHAK